MNDSGLDLAGCGVKVMLCTLGALSIGGATAAETMPTMYRSGHWSKGRSGLCLSWTVNDWTVNTVCDVRCITCLCAVAVLCWPAVATLSWTRRHWATGRVGNMTSLAPVGQGEREHCYTMLEIVPYHHPYWS